MVLEIKTFPDKILRKKAEPVSEVDSDTIELLDNMLETMQSSLGVGLAAPQVGVSKRIIIVDTRASDEENGQLFRVINPEIIASDGEQIGEEGCLSIPGEYENVRRAERVTVKALDETGSEVTIQAEGFLARVFQHEIDHLDGKLFLDRLPSFKKDTLKKVIKRRIAEGDYIVTGME